MSEDFAIFLGVVIFFGGYFGLALLGYHLPYYQNSDNILTPEEQEKMYDYYFNYRQDLSDGDIKTKEFIEKYFYIDNSVNGDFEGIDFEESVEMYQLSNSFAPSNLVIIAPSEQQYGLISRQPPTYFPTIKPNFGYGSWFQLTEGPLYIYPEEYIEESYDNPFEALKALPKDINAIFKRDPSFEFAGKLPEFIDAICYLPYYTGKVDSEGNVIYDKHTIHHDYLIIVDGEIYSHVVWKERFDIKVFPNDIGLLHGW